MPRNPSSKRSPTVRARSAAARDEKEARLQLALAEWTAGQHENISKAAAAHGVARQTLADRLKGWTSKKQAQNSQQALPPAAETALVEHIRHCAAGGFPLNPADVHVAAQGLAHGSSAGSGTTKLGHDWLSGFLLRHPAIKSCWSRCLENACVRSTDSKGIWKWFNRLLEAVQEYRISPNLIFNMDETGFLFGQGGSQRVLVPAGDPASRFKAQPGNRESATVIECIGSGGQVLPPMIITRGKVHTVGEQRRMEDIPATWHFSKGPSGWTDNELATLWVDKVFDAITRPSSPSEWRLLIIDGHKSHVSTKFLEALWHRHIVPLCLPPHCTHVMQPLDVSVFGPLTAAYRRLVTELAPQVPAAGIDKAQFGTLYAQARAKVLMPAAARKAFQDSGMTATPSPDKVLNRLAGSVPAGRKSGAPQKSIAQESTVLQPSTAFNSMLDRFRNTDDVREARGLKRELLEAFQAPQTENSVLQAENLVLRAQEEANAIKRKRARPKTLVGDRMVLTKDRMISREHAERELMEKQPVIEQHQERLRRRQERLAAAHDDGDNADHDKQLAASPNTPTLPSQSLIDLLDDGEALSTIEDSDKAFPPVFYDQVPQASTSRNKL